MIRIAAFIVAAGSALPGALAAAQTLQDPTRPPPQVLAGIAGAPAPSSQPAAPRLQSILVARAPGGRHVAVIDGHTVRLGETFKGARVAQMTPTEVVLLKDGKKQVLKLFPATAAAVTAQPEQR